MAACGESKPGMACLTTFCVKAGITNNRNRERLSSVVFISWNFSVVKIINVIQTNNLIIYLIQVKKDGSLLFFCSQ
jgi:hypothetical protein